ncbi:uncharacterized protein isoform X2 [Rhodnius prolixus]|uniref:uncharacterized protein isoform X2 n=1 Tax=Rhodnius prolixus TaxID=13249 RepID=UPI003D18CBDC
METKVRSYNFDENYRSEVKEKSNLENTKASSESFDSNGKKFKSRSYDEPSSFEINKKLCCWQPPLKCGKETAPYEFSERVNFSNNNEANLIPNTIIQENVKSISIDNSTDHSNLPQKNVHANSECELPLSLSDSSIQNIDKAFHNYKDCEQEMQSVSSIDTIPTDMVIDVYDNLIYDGSSDHDKHIPIVSNKAELVEMKNNPDYFNNQIEKELVTYEKGEVSSKLTVRKETFCYEEHEKPMLTDHTAKQATNKFNLEDLHDGECALEKLGFSVDRYSDVENIDNATAVCSMNDSFSANRFEETSDNIVNKTKEKSGVNQTNENHIVNMCDVGTSDDKFDLLTFTNSQLEKLECAETCEAYNSKKSHHLWLRKEKEQKEILLKLIKEIDVLNNSIIYATNELRTQFSKK